MPSRSGIVRDDGIVRDPAVRVSELLIDVDKDWLSKKIYNAMLVDNYTQFFDHFPGSAMNSIPLKPALDGDKIRGLTPSYTRVKTGGTTTVTSSYVEMYASGNNLDEGWLGNETIDIPPPVTMEAYVMDVGESGTTEVWHVLQGPSSNYAAFNPRGPGYAYDTFWTCNGSSSTYIDFTKVSRGVWLTVKLVRDVNEARLYIDGELKVTITTTLPNGPWTAFLDVRAGYVGGTVTFRWDWYLIRRGT